MGQHGTALVRYKKNVPMTLLTLLVFKGSISGLAIFFAVIRFTEEVNKDIFDTMPGLRIKKVKRIMGCREMTVHTVRYKALSVVYMRGSFPGIIGWLDFMAGSAKLWGRSTHHRVIGNTEDRKADKDPKTNEDCTD